MIALTNKVKTQTLKKMFYWGTADLYWGTCPSNKGLAAPLVNSMGY